MWSSETLTSKLLFVSLEGWRDAPILFPSLQTIVAVYAEIDEKDVQRCLQHHFPNIAHLLLSYYHGCKSIFDTLSTVADETLSWPHLAALTLTSNVPHVIFCKFLEQRILIEAPMRRLRLSNMFHHIDLRVDWPRTQRITEKVDNYGYKVHARKRSLV
jgi:hypothetical protein